MLVIILSKKSSFSIKCTPRILELSVHYRDILYSLIAVEKELKSRLEWWKAKQLEIENEFKVAHQAQDKMPKGKHKRGKEKVSYHNHALSSYAAMLTVQFLVKVGLINSSKI